MTLCVWCGEDVREPVPDALEEPESPVEQGRVHGSLTVIDGTAPRPRARDGEADEPGGHEDEATGRPGRAQATPESGARLSVDAPSGPRLADAASRQPLPEPARQAPAAAAHVNFEPAADPVHRMKARLGSTRQSSVAPAMQQAAAPVVEPRSVVLASAIYVTGSRGLLAGSRYGIGLLGDNLQILGPVDIDPLAIVLTHPLRGIDATGLQSRLIITAGERRRERLALVFMSVAGGTPEGVADAIVAAVADAGAEPR
jgi:hypothetical protein